MISIIAPAYNNPDEVKSLLESIKKSEGIDFVFEAIIVDDGSADRAIERVVEAYDFARCIRLEKNGGAAVARNTGAKIARFDSLLYLDSDVIVFPDTISKAKKYFENEDVKAFIGHLDITPQNEGFFPKYKAIMFNSWLPRENVSTVFTPAVGGIRKEALLKCGGFDESIRGATVEYVKFSYALREQCAIYFYPDLVVRVKINSFKKALYTDYYSTMKWVEMFDEYRKFDNHCTSVSGGAGRLLGFISIVSLPLCVVFKLYALWACIFAAFFYLNRNFFVLVIKRESPWFLARAIVTYMILSVSTILGGISGLALIVRKRMKSA
ncbi:MAG: glycosyltransferase [Candidatus Omnitrophica bacterium]|nr:glycosyltransferase [Candidatus Omnitrophota bacterium]MBU1808059.1 glycosyltransferase [Candidatus Omnitrophota bacterium]